MQNLLSLGTILAVVSGAISFMGWSPPAYNAVRVCLVITAILLSLKALFWMFMVDRDKRPKAAIAATALVLVWGSFVATWLWVDSREAAAQRAPTPPPTQQFNQGTGQQYNAPGGQIYINPPPQPIADSGAITQAGTVVGQAFGGRRSPTDATVFEFVEINHAQSFNLNAPFEYQGIKLQNIHADTVIGMDVSRPQDGRIIKDMTAKIQ